MILLRTTLLAGLTAAALRPQAPQPPAAVVPAPVAAAAPAEYGGPAVLSRGGLPSIFSLPRLTFRPFVSVTGDYDTGLTGVTVDENGNLPNPNAYGASISAGVSGAHAWRKAMLALDYSASYRHYNQQTYFDGTNQMLGLVYSRQVTRHSTLTLREGAGTYSRNYGYFAGPAIDPSLINTLPVNDIFDNRVIFLSSMANLTYRKSARLSFSFGGNQFLVRRRSSALYGSTGAGAMVDASYRLNRNSSIGVAYNFTHFAFTQGFGASDIHTVSLMYSRRLTRNWEFAGGGGVIRVETLALAQVQVDPVVAALTGQLVGVEAFYGLHYSSSLQARLSRSFRRASLNINYARGVSPGNGVYLTSQMENANIGFSYSGLRRWNVGASAGYSKMTSLTQIAGTYTGYLAGIGVTRNLTRTVHFIGRVDVRQYDNQAARNFSRVSYHASIGLGFTPGELPLKLW